VRLPSVNNDICYVAVVDDDASMCRSLSRLLRTAGYQPVTYASAEAFLQDTKRPQFDCLVLDIQLEGMSGLELSRRLAAVQSVIPVLFITAHDCPEARAEALACGCAGYFLKKEPGECLLECLRKVIGNRSSSVPLPP
jgi:FixJ family two-component response regulator